MDVLVKILDDFIIWKVRNVRIAIAAVSKTNAIWKLKMKKKESESVPFF